MSRRGAIRRAGVTCAGILSLAVVVQCKSPTGSGTYDIDKDGLPVVVLANYVDLAHVAAISKFRSSAGHDYADDFESCRSMKHYFWFAGGDPGSTHDPSWTTIPIYSPVSGTIASVTTESTGDQPHIQVDGYPAFTVILFHVDLDAGIGKGTHVTAGQRLGTHASDETTSDVAVSVATPDGRRLVSFFDVMSDAVFATYQARGVSDRSMLTIPQAVRDANPLQCSGETFVGQDTLQGWVTLS